MCPEGHHYRDDFHCNTITVFLQRSELILYGESFFSQSVSSTQTIDILKQLLRAGGVSYDERLFSSEGGVADLGDEPFVSIELDQPVEVLNPYNWLD